MFDKILQDKGVKEAKVTTVAIIMISISFLLTTIFSLWSLYQKEIENAATMSKVVAGRIYDSINAEITKPIMVSLGMAHNSFLLDALEGEAKLNEKANIELMQRYLYTVKDYLHYDTAFVVSENSKRYYTYKGLNKYIDIQNDEHDVWYKLFVESGKAYDLDVDVDEVNGKRWTVFVNTRIMDNRGKFLGACGVGVRMDKLQEVFEAYEKEYGIKINMVNNDGLVQVDTDSVNIENAYLTNAPIGRKESKEYIFKATGNGGYIITKYVEDLGWYLVVQKQGTNFFYAVTKILVLNFCAYLLVLLLLIFAIRNVLRQENQRLMRTATTDRVTGLGNRNYFKMVIGGENALMDFRKNPAIAVFDIDNFKTVNDTYGHLEGDHILKTISELASEVLKDKATTLRWGGDEFVIIFNVPKAEAIDLCEKLCAVVASETIVTISMGVSGVDKGKTFKSGFYRADQAMYYIKEHGRNGLMDYQSIPCNLE